MFKEFKTTSLEKSNDWILLILLYPISIIKEFKGEIYV